MKKQIITASILLAAAIVICVVSGMNFVSLREPDLLIPGQGVSEVKKLSDYLPSLAGTNGDSDVYVLRGAKEGGTALVLGGTHGNEPAGYLAAVLLVENAQVEAGTLYVVPRANNSGLTHNDPQEASPQYLHFEGKSGPRKFRYGSRATNPVDQWPDPDVYVHASSGQHLSGSETRNLNRGYPGREDGTFTERVCYAITQLVRTEGVDITFDLHEASPEYPVIHATVAHERAMDVASFGMFDLDMMGISMSLEPSPTNLHGLTHRELGDYTDTLALLMETANASQGRLRGRTDEALALTGKDECYVKAAQLGLLYVPYDENGHPIEERVGRHIQGVQSYLTAYSDLNGKPITLTNLPSYDELLSGRYADYLN